MLAAILFKHHAAFLLTVALTEKARFRETVALDKGTLPARLSGHPAQTLACKPYIGDRHQSSGADTTAVDRLRTTSPRVDWQVA